MASKHVDTIDVNSGALARVGMDALSLSGALEARGIETIPHLTTRDANLIGLQAMLLGAWTVGGVRNVLAITGDPPSLGQLSGIARRLRSRFHRPGEGDGAPESGTDWAGKNLGGATNFTIGVAVNPLAEDLDEELRRFHAKVEAGAHFAMTQPIFDPEHWEQFLKRMGGKCADPDPGRPVAAEQLQAGPAPAQRSARHRDSRAAAEATRRRGRLRARTRFCARTQIAGLGERSAQFGNCRRLPDSSVQAVRRNPGSFPVAPVGRASACLVLIFAGRKSGQASACPTFKIQNPTKTEPGALPILRWGRHIRRSASALNQKQD